MKDPNTMTREELLAAVNDLVDHRAKLISALVCPDCGGEIDCSDADGDCTSCGARRGDELEHGSEIRS